MTIVICGAGIAGISVAHALTRFGVRDIILVDREPPLSLTSAMSTEAFRIHWPGFDGAMVKLMGLSIARIELLADEARGRINLKRAGYLYVTKDPRQLDQLVDDAWQTQEFGAGEVRVHNHRVTTYNPNDDRKGIDLLDGSSLLHAHFPWLDHELIWAMHVRNAGWFSGQQLGQFMLEQARSSGASLLAGEVVGVETTAQTVSAVVVELPNREQRRIPCSTFINAAGPHQVEVARLVGVELPVTAQLHLKMSMTDTHGVVPRSAPMTILADEITIPWDHETREMFAGDPELSKLLRPLPGGAHLRPDGTGQTLLMLWNWKTDSAEQGSSSPVFPIPVDPAYPELTLRGLSSAVPGLANYDGNPPDLFVDGGYYMRTPENRPLIGPAGPFRGSFILGGLSGFGLMAAPGAGVLLAEQILGVSSPAFARSFLLSRYDDPAYLERIQSATDAQL